MSAQSIDNSEKRLRGELEELYKLLSEMSQNPPSSEKISEILSKIKLVLDKVSEEGISDKAIHKQILGSVNEALKLIDNRIAELDRLKQEKYLLLFA